MEINKATKRIILNSYFDLNFPASYSSLPRFKKALKQELNIDISTKSLRTLMKNNLHYQRFLKKPKNGFLLRRMYSDGVGLLKAYSKS